MKHSVLIIAHNNFEQLQLLLDMLDDVRNDIYVHIDKKVKHLPSLSVTKSKLFVLSHRIDVRWGDYSQIQAELLLFESAYKNGPYQIYHLISGVDLPIKSNDYIHDFIDQHPGVEFIQFSSTNEIVKARIAKHHFFMRHYKTQHTWLGVFLGYLRKYLGMLCDKLSPRTIPFELKFGANWVSITHDFCGFLLSEKKFIAQYFQYSCCADELYKQTVLWKSPYRDRVYPVDGPKRLVDWERGNPYVWGRDCEEDLERIKHSDCLFVRKIDQTQYPEFVRRLVSMVIKS